MRLNRNTRRSPSKLRKLARIRARHGFLTIRPAAWQFLRRWRACPCDLTDTSDPLLHQALLCDAFGMVAPLRRSPKNDTQPQIVDRFDCTDSDIDRLYALARELEKPGPEKDARDLAAEAHRIDCQKREQAIIDRLISEARDFPTAPLDDSDRSV